MLIIWNRQQLLALEQNLFEGGMLVLKDRQDTLDRIEEAQTIPECVELLLLVEDSLPFKYLKVTEETDRPLTDQLPLFCLSTPVA